MTVRESLIGIVHAMQGRRVVVYGDIVADRFIYGTPKRISREAPVLILRQYREDVLLGGAGNAMSNVRSLGGIPVPVATVGPDAAGDRLLAELRERGIETDGVLRVERHRTPTKTRVLGGMQHATRQQIVRFDVEDAISLTADERAAVAELLRSEIEKGDAAIVSDYGYGAVEPGLVAELCGSAGARPVTLDSRYDVMKFQGVTAATPNEEEAAAVSGIALGESDEESAALQAAASAIRDRLGAQAILITRGSRGMALLENDRNGVELIPVHGTDQVADVTGAGDTVIATFTLALAAGASFSDAARIANYAASVVVMKMGTATISGEELVHTIERDEELS